MSESATPTPPPARETLMPEREVGARRYTVVVTEYAEVIQHNQTWRVIGKTEHGREDWGHKTTADRVKIERQIFKGDFSKAPRISELAKLMENDE